ncbi:hypothetical protein AB0L66_10565 [Streptomyces sp. NPDC052207]|uniref:hypothetical protein n=1 Tax=Streptomyces sp. NPDC052207 TaxID=3155418 RepID=UPI00341BDE2C
MADDSTPPQRFRGLASPRAYIAFSILLCAFIALYLMGAVGHSWDDIASVASAFLGCAAYLLVKPAPRADAASRERLRAAEYELEESLRHVSREAANDGRGVLRVILTEKESTPSGDVAGPDDETGPLPAKPPVDVPGAVSRPLALANLWAVTNRRLDLYHEIATDQARLSFRNAQVAMVIGFFLLVGFVTVALRASSTTGAVVAGGLGAVSAALAGYVSRTFVKSQETAAGHLKAYFDQPLEFARYLTAERLITESGLTEAQRQEAVMALVKGLATPPGGGALPREASEQQQA